MKKTVLVLAVSLVLVFAVSYVSLADMTVKAGYDLGGTFSNGVSSNSIDGGFSLGFEYTSKLNDNLAIGGGLEYQLLRKVVGTPSSISFIPVYGLVKYNFDKLYLAGRLGYDIYTQDPAPPSGYSVTGGIYIGAGVGYNITENMSVEAIYGIHNMSVSFMGITQTANYSKIGLSFGYKF